MAINPSYKHFGKFFLSIFESYIALAGLGLRLNKNLLQPYIPYCALSQLFKERARGSIRPSSPGGSPVTHILLDLAT